jgi:ribosomal protein S18 acetylase RimI-like enzyme
MGCGVETDPVSAVMQGFFPRGLRCAAGAGGQPLQPRLGQGRAILARGKPAVGMPAIQPQAHGSAMQLPPGLNFGRAAGQPLPSAVQQRMESFFGASFGDVRVHVGPEASSIGALAFTHGANLYFAPGQYNPHTPHGLQLLGHELTHVLQQRAGRVRNPFGSGVAVVQDHALEAEADRMGQRAALQPMMPRRAPTAGTPVQRKPVVQPKPVYRVSGPVRSGHDSFRIVAGAQGGSNVGSVMVHARDKSSIELTDLGVDPAHRQRGVGTILMSSALKTGQQLGKSKVTLAAQDSGSGHLTRWYERMGFSRVGVNGRGYAVLEAPIARVLAGVHHGRQSSL